MLALFGLDFLNKLVLVNTIKPAIITIPAVIIETVPIIGKFTVLFFISSSELILFPQ
tara:strand:+ start:4678 stop:4848 length:171 start_codon:yes stop_codon:yes gene_type:complete